VRKGQTSAEARATMRIWLSNEYNFVVEEPMSSALKSRPGERDLASASECARAPSESENFVPDLGSNNKRLLDSEKSNRYPVGAGEPKNN
jgi:hypothetical protein